MNTELSFYIISHFGVGVAATILGLLVLLKDKKNKTNILFFLMSLSVAVWGFSYTIWLLADNYDSALFWSRALNFGAIFIPIFHFHWILKVLDKKRNKIIFSLYILAIACSLFSFSNFYVRSVAPVFNFPYWPQLNWMYVVYLVFGWIMTIIYAMTLLIKEFFNSAGQRKKQIGFVIVGSAIGFIGGSFNFPLMFGLEWFHPVGSPLVIAYPIFFGYSMMKYGLMNIKVFATQLLIITINIINLVRIISSTNKQDYVINFFFFVLIFIFSYLLMKNFSVETKQKEELESLTKKLAQNNKKLKELDRAKNEFISITAHQLRTPPTVIKGYITLAQDDPGNKMTKDSAESLERALISNERLIDLVEDILNVSRIESGNMKYESRSINIYEDILNDLYNAFSIKAEQKGLELILNKPESSLPVLDVDGKKIREVVSNLVDNAIKYTRKGSVEFGARKKGDNIRIEVKDTGVGIPKDELPYLFKKFSRGKNPGRLGAEGTGLGIFVGKKIVEDHGGKIWIESAGENKGSTFIVEIPINFHFQEKPLIADVESGAKEREGEVKSLIEAI